ncbi:hypothetical protein OHA72_24665 [Dactylosporangium sp. NBC_01737]|uniref:hypothetical protein n=1 Tax=Dactylosporangium sp. NBC_01737 TaxID=2975959 RepID=UPI002E0D41B5|nr:hypothetical protein OHA72_24665 [Dactylosporangium sp. NBC_01737]
MRESRVEEEFARFAEDAAGTFRPLPLHALPRRSRRGRLRLWLVGAVVVVLTASGGAALRTAGRHDATPVPVPTPTPAPTAGFSFAERPVVLAGASGPHHVRFADQQHGWVFYRNCDGTGSCDPRLGRTADGGRTWQQRPLPDMRDADGTVPAWGLVASDSERITLYSFSKIYWSSIDAGNTWTREDVATYAARHEPPLTPATTDRFITTGGRLKLDGVGDVGVVPVRAGTRIREVVRTPGGLWALLEREQVSGRALLVYSANGTTWQDVREEPSYTYLLPSADRGDVWYTGFRDGRLALLSAGKVIEQASPPPLEVPQGIVPIGGGRLLVATLRKELLVWSAGSAEPLAVPMPAQPSIGRLADGAVLIYDPRRMDDPVTVGTVGGGWVRYT